MFRLEKDQALINRLGFNNHGSEIVAKKIAEDLPSGFLGITLVQIRKLRIRRRLLFMFIKTIISAGYLTINISSPNTEGLRNFHDQKNLKSFLRDQ